MALGRITRAKAAEVAEKLHIDEDAVLELPRETVEDCVDLASKTPQKDGRAPLEEIAPNSAGKEDDVEIASLRKSTKGRKGGRKGAKGKKTNLANSTASQPDLVADEREREDVAEHVGETTTDEVVQGVSEIAIDGPSHIDTTTQDEAIELTQAQLDTTLETQVTVEVQNAAEPSVSSPTPLQSHIEAADQRSQPATPKVFDAPASPPLSALPSVIASLRKGTPGQRSTSNKENVEPMQSLTPVPSTLTPTPSRSHRRSTTYDALEEAVVLGVTPPAVSREKTALELPITQSTPRSRQSPGLTIELLSLQSPQIPTSPPARYTSPRATSPKSEDAIGEMDALEEAVEKISAEMPVLLATPAKPRTRKPAPVVRTTKASLARLSLAHPDKTLAVKDHTLGRPRPSTMLGRANSVRQSTALRPEPVSKRIVSAGNKRPEPAAAADRVKRETVIPHSKPRPISLSFPTPPPPPKSRKAPTTSTFQLPGEAIAAKLKAAREERTKKDVEADLVADRKRTNFKARPAPAALKTVPEVRQTAASRARVPSSGSQPAGPATGMARTKSVTTASSSARARVPAKTPAAHPSASETTLKSKPALLDRLSVSKRTSTSSTTAVTANTSKPLRTSLSTSTNGPTPVTSSPRVLSKGTLKGKEVFNRAAAAKGAAEQAKQDKEAAAKRARAEAAERGRQLSRDWAEKQRTKKLGLKGKAGTTTAAGEVSMVGECEEAGAVVVAAGV